MENNELRLVRRYTRIEAAEELNISKYWLRDWVAENRIPHQRKGTQRGVWFTWDDIIAIGAMLPSLMSQRQANGRAEAPQKRSGATDERVAAATPGDLPPELLEEFAGLRSLRSA